MGRAAQEPGPEDDQTGGAALGNEQVDDQTGGDAQEDRKPVTEVKPHRKLAVDLLGRLAAKAEPLGRPTAKTEFLRRTGRKLADPLRRPVP